MAWKQGKRSGDSRIISPSVSASRVGAQRAYTITELLTVVVLIGLAATVALPSLTPGESRKLDLVATEMANAMRFARSEAMRLGVARGFRQHSGGKYIKVFSMDTGTTPATLVYDVYHPVDKQLYDRRFGKQPFGFDGNTGRTRTYRGTCDKPLNVYFDAGGTPWCADPDNVLLVRYEVRLTLGSSSRVVTLYGITGRVTIQ